MTLTKYFYFILQHCASIEYDGWCCVQKHVVKKIEHNLGLVQDWWSENEVSHFKRRLMKKSLSLMLPISMKLFIAMFDLIQLHFILAWKGMDYVMGGIVSEPSKVSDSKKIRVWAEKSVLASSIILKSTLKIVLYY